MSEVFSYNIDAVVEPINQSTTSGLGHGAGVERRVLLADRALDLLESLAASAEHSLSSIAAQDTNLVQATRTAARANALRTDPRLAGLAASMNHEMPGFIESLACLAGGLAPTRVLSASSGIALAGAVGAQFERAIEKGSQRQRAENRALLVDAVQGAMRDIGYQPSAPRPKGRDFLVAARSAAGQTLVVQVDAGQGKLLGDFAGYCGTACTTDGRKFEERLRVRGLAVRRTSRRVHGNPDGGPLVRETQPTRGTIPPHERVRQGPSHMPSRGPANNG